MAPCMDVKYINPFLQGTSEVLMKMASLMVTAGKPYAKTDDTAPGDISGIIGITGDAVGSLAISFSEGCICSIVTGMLGELHMEVNQEVIDAVGELTNMVSGAARRRLEGEGMVLYAAIPTVVLGKGHSVRHILNSPSLVIPFETDGGTFYVDVCLKNVKKKHVQSDSPIVKPAPAAMTKAEQVIKAFEKPAVTSLYPRGAAAKSAVHQPQAATPVSAAPEPPSTSAEQAPAPDAAPKTPEEKIEALKKAMENAAAKRDEAASALKKNPFMPLDERKKLNRVVESCDAAIKRIKLDISAVRMIAEIKEGRCFHQEPFPTSHQYDIQEALVAAWGRVGKAPL